MEFAKAKKKIVHLHFSLWITDKQHCRDSVKHTELPSELNEE